MFFFSIEEPSHANKLIDKLQVIGHQLMSGMGTAFLHSPPTGNLVCEESALLYSTSYRFHSRQYLRCNRSDLKPFQTLASALPLRVCSFSRAATHKSEEKN